MEYISTFPHLGTLPTLLLPKFWRNIFYPVDWRNVFKELDKKSNYIILLLDLYACYVVCILIKF